MIDEEALQRLRNDPQFQRGNRLFWRWLCVLVVCFAVAEVVAWYAVTGGLYAS